MMPVTWSRNACGMTSCHFTLYLLPASAINVEVSAIQLLLITSWGEGLSVAIKVFNNAPASFVACPSIICLVMLVVSNGGVPSFS